MNNEIIAKIKQKKIKVAIIGLGYVGLPLCMRFIKAGIEVLGIDADKKKINFLRNGKSYISGLKINKLSYFKKNKSFVSNNYKLTTEANIIIIALPTPLKKNYTPDLRYINSCISELRKFILPNQTVILESTVYPGATDKYFKKLLKNKKLVPGKDIFLGFSPERENPGDPLFTYNITPKVISGQTKLCEKIIKEIYKHIVKKVFVAESIKVAELSKLLENTYRSINIGFINEFKIISNKLDINVWDVIKAAKTKNFGFRPFAPGPGIGGHCIPVDPFYLDWAAKNRNYRSKFINASKNINKEVFNWSFNKIYNFFKNKKIMNKKILYLGVTYKANVDDLRESPSLALFNKLYKEKLRIKFHDPYIKKIQIEFKNKKKYIHSIKSYKNALKESEVVIIATNHDYYNYKKILQKSKFIVDLRGKYINAKDKNIYKF